MIRSALRPLAANQWGPIRMIRGPSLFDHGLHGSHGFNRGVKPLPQLGARLRVFSLRSIAANPNRALSRPPRVSRATCLDRSVSFSLRPLAANQWGPIRMIRGQDSQRFVIVREFRRQIPNKWQFARAQVGHGCGGYGVSAIFAGHFSRELIDTEVFSLSGFLKDLNRGSTGINNSSRPLGIGVAFTCEHTRWPTRTMTKKPSSRPSVA
jgi:hypothetical protein